VRDAHDPGAGASRHRGGLVLGGIINHNKLVGFMQSLRCRVQGFERASNQSLFIVCGDYKRDHFEVVFSILSGARLQVNHILQGSQSRGAGGGVETYGADLRSENNALRLKNSISWAKNYESTDR
jgi:hypothetical protein